LIATLPCPACIVRQAARSVPFSPDGAGLLSLEKEWETLKLKPEHHERYEEMRRKVETEIAVGIRTAGSGFYD
jgi:hypothetical protein